MEIWPNEVCDREELIEDLLALKDVILIEESCPPEEEEDFA